ncbi:MAG: CYTH domain-containing protein [Endozoicomonadaceae bacterium]|nr:CYTH domain-containing protein [Endozoicomonadaceae bacterium]
MPKETELKLLIAPEAHSHLLSNPLLKESCVAGQCFFQFQNTYFDTVDQRLHQARVSLRIRENQGRYIQTLKTRGQSRNGLSRRGEWEWSLERERLDMALLQPVWPDALITIDFSALTPVFNTNFQRTAFTLNWDKQHSACVELSLDVGEIRAGMFREAISEVEIELLSGSEEALHEIAEQLCRSVTLEPCDVSKAERGYALINRQLLAQ